MGASASKGLIKPEPRSAQKLLGAFFKGSEVTSDFKYMYVNAIPGHRRENVKARTHTGTMSSTSKTESSMSFRTRNHDGSGHCKIPKR